MNRLQIPPIIILVFGFFCFSDDRNFVTACDTEHFLWLKGLIRNICLYHKDNLNIVVFDLGLTDEDKLILQKDYSFLKIIPVEIVHPDLCKKFVVRKNGRLARGWYAWKPVVLHQACRLFPYFIYMDSGIRLNTCLDDIFFVIQKEGYFLLGCNHLIEPMTTRYIKHKFELDKKENSWILQRSGISAGIQGISRRMYDEYIKPIYEMAFDLKNFEDDGTAPWGFGGARHDQTIFSILAVKLGLKIHSNNIKFFQKSKSKVSAFLSPQYFKLKNYKENPNATKYKLL